MTPTKCHILGKNIEFFDSVKLLKTKLFLFKKNISLSHHALLDNFAHNFLTTPNSFLINK
jgi:hypothetical protein